MAGNYDAIIKDVLMNTRPTTAQVPPDRMRDVDPAFYVQDPIPVGDEVDTEVDPFLVQQNMPERVMDRQATGEGALTYADAIMRAMEARQKAGRR
jgi:hypothetical protein